MSKHFVAWATSLLHKWWCCGWDRRSSCNHTSWIDRRSTATVALRVLDSKQKPTVMYTTNMFGVAVRRRSISEEDNKTSISIDRCGVYSSHFLHGVHNICKDAQARYRTTFAQSAKTASTKSLRVSIDKGDIYMGDMPIRLWSLQGSTRITSYHGDPVY